MKQNNNNNNNNNKRKMSSLKNYLKNIEIFALQLSLVKEVWQRGATSV